MPRREHAPVPAKDRGPHRPSHLAAPVVKQTTPSVQTATTGVTCGRPSARTIEIQNSSAAWRIRQVSSHSTATAAGSLYWWSKVVTGVFISALIIGHGCRW